MTESNVEVGPGLPRIVHVVRRYGPIGGMERYVWELTHGLAAEGVAVMVVCEEVLGAVANGIDVVVVPSAPPRPRWRAMQLFRDQVKAVIGDTDLCGSIVHSHERTLGHHVTTFHGPPIAPSKRLSIWQSMSRRVRRWRAMEAEEILGKSVQAVLPVSSLVLRQLVTCYPELSEKFVQVAWPGVAPSLDIRETKRAGCETRFVFVGREFVRKGLSFAVQVVDAYRYLTGIEATLDVVGPSVDELPSEILSTPFVNPVGWSPSVEYAKYAALIHPAKAEPFGMVVTEARRVGLPVICSDQTGAGEIQSKGVSVFSLASTPQDWARGLVELVTCELAQLPETAWSWSDLVRLHVDKIYPSIRIL